MPVLRTFNVEEGLPSLEEARKLVMEEIRKASTPSPNPQRFQ
jgi:hypothetical protein